LAASASSQHAAQNWSAARILADVLVKPSVLRKAGVKELLGYLQDTSAYGVA